MSATFYDEVGGEPTFTLIVDRFYAAVVEDPVLRPLYPDEDLPEAPRRLRMFLEQYWGGPTTYHDERGHPRLRMRHVPFAIGLKERDAWLHHMTAAIQSVGLTPAQERTLLDYVTMAAHSMVNTTP